MDVEEAAQLVSDSTDRLCVRLYRRRDGALAPAHLHPPHALGRVVNFTGHIPEAQVQDRMMAADIFVFPTLYGEGFPMAMFTAMALGLPVVTTQIRILRDGITEPDHCLVAERNAESLADRIEQLIADKPLRERMSANNLAYGKTLGPDEIAKEFEAVYLKLIGEE